MSTTEEVQKLPGKYLPTVTYKLQRTRTSQEPHGFAIKPMRVDWWRRTPPGSGNISWDHTSYQYNGGFDFTRHYPNYTKYSVDWVKNPAYDRKKYGLPTDTGSDFTQVNAGWYNNTGYYISGIWDYTSVWRWMYQGTICIDPWPFSHEGIDIRDYTGAFPSDVNIESYGPVLWNRAKPAKPLLSLSSFIYELREMFEGLGSLRAAFDTFKGIANYFLAIRFGWGPFLSDLQKIVKKALILEKQIKFILANIGKPVHGHAKYPTIVTCDVLQTRTGLSSSGLLTTVSGRFGYPNTSANTLSKITLTKRQDIWFSGMFTYWYDGEPPPSIEMADRLLGLYLTPVDIWNVSPFSWLMDWCYNAQNLLETISARVADHQISTYAYVMAHTTREYEYFGTDGTVLASVTKKFDTKARRHVNPFGKASDPNSMSNDQLAILAALGIQRWT